MLLNASYNQTSIKEIKNSFVINKVKEIVHRYDDHAEIVLFGSRARGDWDGESDWDFLILSEQEEQSRIKEKIRQDVLKEIEYVTFDVVFTLFHNKKVWKKNMQLEIFMKV
jgi:predicted nucleotidyltransferase